MSFQFGSTPASSVRAPPMYALNLLGAPSGRARLLNRSLSSSASVEKFAVL